MLITEYPAIVSLFETSRKLAKNANMMYTHIIMDVGAAIKAYHVVWNDANYWNDINIQLRRFPRYDDIFWHHWYFYKWQRF